MLPFMDRPDTVSFARHLLPVFLLIRDLGAWGLQSKCSQEMGTEGSRMGQGKAPGRDIVPLESPSA